MTTTSSEPITLSVQMNMVLPSLLGVLFIILKLVGIIPWSWVWVLSPFWVPIMVVAPLWLFTKAMIFWVTRGGR